MAKSTCTRNGFHHRTFNNVGIGRIANYKIFISFHRISYSVDDSYYAFGDFFYKDKDFSKQLLCFKYFSALFFGLIHGMGFSNYLRALLGSEKIVVPLLAFNIGLEIGQILIVGSFLTLTSALICFFRINRRDLALITAGAAAGVAVLLMIERFAALFPK